MTDVLSEIVQQEDLKRFERIYHDQLYRNNVTPDCKFEYAWCLVRSKYPVDIQKGIILLEELYNTHEDRQRDYLYYLAVGNARLKKYVPALNYVRSFLLMEPGNQQVLNLQRAIKQDMGKDKLLSMAIAGGIVVTISTLVGLGMVLANKIK